MTLRSEGERIRVYLCPTCGKSVAMTK
jgi:hypothetical protein